MTCTKLQNKVWVVFSSHQAPTYAVRPVFTPRSPPSRCGTHAARASVAALSEKKSVSATARIEHTHGRPRPETNDAGSGEPRAATRAARMEGQRPARKARASRRFRALPFRQRTASSSSEERGKGMRERERTASREKGRGRAAPCPQNCRPAARAASRRGLSWAAGRPRPPRQTAVMQTTRATQVIHFPKWQLLVHRHSERACKCRTSQTSRPACQHGACHR